MGRLWGFHNSVLKSANMPCHHPRSMRYTGPCAVHDTLFQLSRPSAAHRAFRFKSSATGLTPLRLRAFRFNPSAKEQRSERKSSCPPPTPPLFLHMSYKTPYVLHPAQWSALDAPALPLPYLWGSGPDKPGLHPKIGQPIQQRPAPALAPSLVRRVRSERGDSSPLPFAILMAGPLRDQSPSA